MGWEPKKGAAVLDVHHKKWSQSAGPAFAKVARLMLHDPVATTDDLARAMERVRQELFIEHELPRLEREHGGWAAKTAPSTTKSATTRPTSPSMSTKS